MLSLSEFFDERVVALVSDRSVDFRSHLKTSKVMSFPNACLPARQALIGNPQQIHLGTGPDEAMTGSPTEIRFQRDLANLKDWRTFGDDSSRFNGGIFSLTDEQKDFFRHKTGITIERAASAKQVHGTKILDVSKEFLTHGKLLEADGLLTSDMGLPLAVRTADCLSIFIFDSKKKAIGLVHAGWRGSLEGILRLAIERMVHKWHSNPKDFKIAFGPSIRSCCYQVGEEFKGYFPAEVQKKATGLYLDLVAANRSQLHQVDVQDKNIFDCGICTCCDESFFSYRREGEKTGRMLSLMMLR